jgi:hypothetical protein
MPSSQSFRDAAMWMFKNTDVFNRYVTGGAALEKWDHWARKLMTPGGKWNPNLFMRKMRFGGRDDWVRRDLEKILAQIPGKPTKDNLEFVAKHMEAAKAKFVTDVMADTQWLYGAMDAPLINSRFGVVSKTGVIFQSWWMNYLTALEKWFFRTGDLSQKTERLFTFMASAAIGGELMVHGTGMKGSQAWGTVGMAPIPSQAFLPPTWAPFAHALETAGSLAVFEPERAKQGFKRLTKSFEIFAPGGLQVGKMIRGARDDGTEGFVRQGLNAYWGTGERFLLGRK